MMKMMNLEEVNEKEWKARKLVYIEDGWHSLFYEDIFRAR